MSDSPGKSQILLAELDDAQFAMKQHKTLGSLASDFVTSVAYGADGRIWAGGLIDATTSLAAAMDAVVTDPPNGFVLGAPSLQR